MKKIMILMALAIVAVCPIVVSCSKTEINDPAEGINNVLVASISSCEKTFLDGNDVIWNNTDKIRAFGAKDSYVSTSIEVLGKGNQAKFTFDSPETLNYTCYPADACTVCKNGVFSFVMPTSQRALAGSFGNGANFAAGKVVGTQVDMKNAGALLSVDLKNDNIISISVSAKGIAGESTLTLDGANVASVASGSGDMIRMSGTFEKGKTYYFAVLPGNYTNFTLRFANSEGKTATFTNSKGLNIKRNSNIVLFDAEIPSTKWSDDPDVLKFGASSVLPGTAYGLKTEGVFLDTDKVYVSVDEASKTELGGDFFKVTANSLEAYMPRADIGKKVQFFLKRGDKFFEISNNISVAKPEVAQGYIPDDKFLDKFKTGNNGICAKYFDVCDMVDLEMANNYNIFPETEGWLYFTDGQWESVEGLELFNAWSADEWTKADVRMWTSKNLVNVDLSKWKARTAIRLTSSAKVEKVIFGPNMFGGPIGGPKFKIVDASLCENLQYIEIKENDVPLLELLDLRTGNSICGANMNLTKLTTVSDASKLVIRIKADFYKKHTIPNAWQNGIYKAWQNGATIEVYKTEDRSVRLGVVTPYVLDQDALPEGADYDPSKNWIWGGPNYSIYGGTTVKPGTGKGLAIVSTGDFETTDKVWISVNGEEATELDSKFYSVTTTELKVYTHRNRIGEKVQYWIVREGKKYPLCAKIDVVTPSVAEGYIPDEEFLNALKKCNSGILTKYFDVCDMVDLNKANTENVFDNTTKFLGLTDLSAVKSIEGLELFNAWTAERWDYADLHMWSNDNITKADFSQWKARVYVRLTNCGKLETVKLGENMFGGSFGGSSLKSIDATVCSKLDGIDLKENDIPALNLLDLRTKNSLCGKNLNLTKLTTVSNASNLVIKIKEDFYKLHTVPNAWQNGIYEAWQKGAKVEVYDNDVIDSKLGTCPNYSTNPNALPSTDKYIEGTNWDCGAVKYACESYEKAIEEANKALTRYNNWKGSDETVIFPIVTDNHATGVSGNKQFREVAYTDDVFHYDFIAHLGDIATAQKLTKAIIDNTAAQQNSYKGITIFTPGNHDWNNDWNDSANQYDITPTKMSETFQVPSKSRQGGENIHIVNGTCYGYYDIPAKNFRIFFLDSFGNTASGVSIRWNDDQLQWLMNTLAETPENYSLVFISHVMPHDSGKWASNTWPIEWKTPSYRIRAMLEAFIARTSGKDGNVSWDFTKAKGKIAAFITGDTHVDWWGVENGLNMFISQGSGFMSTKEMKPEHRYESFDWTTKGTFFTHMIAIKPAKGELKAFRIGAAGDESFDFGWSY